MTDEQNPLSNLEKQTPSGFIKFLSEPLSKRGWPTWLVYVLAGIGVIYIINPTLGIFEFIPDVLPFVGNLDEGLAVMLILFGVVELVEGKKYRKTKILSNEPDDEAAAEKITTQK